MDSIIQIHTDTEGKIVRVECINVPLYKKKKSKSYIFYNSGLKVLGYSEVSEKDALKDFEQALAVFIDVHVQNKTLVNTLRSFGFIKSDGKYTAPNVPTYITDRLPKVAYSYA